MFERLPGTDITESWAEAWRRHRGMDRWPLVEAQVIHRKVIPGDEGPDSYRLTLRYKPPGGPASDTYWTKSLTVTQGTTLATAQLDDRIMIHCHPEDPERIAQQDVTQLVQHIHTLLFVGVLGLVFLYLALTHRLHWGSGDD